MKCSPDQEQRGRSMFKIFVPCCLGSTISSQVAARYELVQTPFCLRGRNTWNFQDLCDFTVRSSNAGCIPEGPSNQSLNLISCWYHPAPVRVFGVTEKDHAASAVRLVAGPRCSSRQPSLCRWSRFLQHSQVSTSRAAARPFRFSRISLKILSLSAIKIFLGKPPSDQKSIGKGQCLTRKN